MARAVVAAAALDARVAGTTAALGPRSALGVGAALRAEASRTHQTAALGHRGNGAAGGAAVASLAAPVAAHLKPPAVRVLRAALAGIARAHLARPTLGIDTARSSEATATTALLALTALRVGVATAAIALKIADLSARAVGGAAAVTVAARARTTHLT